MAADWIDELEITHTLLELIPLDSLRILPGNGPQSFPISSEQNVLTVRCLETFARSSISNDFC
jgi:hypothetical protein